MAKENQIKDSPVLDALRKLKDEEADLLQRLRPIQEAIGALDKIMDKSLKKVVKPASQKEHTSEADEVLKEVGIE